MRIDHKQKIDLIVHVISSITDHGAQKNLKLFIKETRKKKLFHHIVISIKKPNYSSNVFKDLEEMDTKIIELNLLKNFQYIKDLFIKNGNTKLIIFGWMYHGMLYGYLLSKIFKINKKLIWTIRHGEPFHKGINKFTKLIIIILSFIHKFEKIPIFVNSYCGIENHINIGFQKNQMIFWPNFFENEEFNKQKLPKINKDKFYILYPARWHPQKNHNMSIKILNELRKFYKLPFFLILIGQDIKLFEKKIKKEKKFDRDTLNAIIFEDQSQNIDFYYNKTDIVISTSSFGEGLQNIILEGILQGKLVYSTNVGDANRILSKKFLSNKNDYKDMSKKIAFCFENLKDKDFENFLKVSHRLHIKKIKNLCNKDAIVSSFIKYTF